MQGYKPRGVGLLVCQSPAVDPLAWLADREHHVSYVSGCQQALDVLDGWPSLPAEPRPERLGVTGNG
jgi:hypothetical protein